MLNKLEASESVCAFPLYEIKYSLTACLLKLVRSINQKQNASQSWQMKLELESPNTDMLLQNLLLITHNYTQSNSKTS